MSAKYIEFSKLLRELRESKGLTQRQLAKKLGIPHGTWAGYESGYRFPESPDILKKIADFFGVPVEKLMQAAQEDEMLGGSQLARYIQDARYYRKRISELATKLARGEGVPQDIISDLNDMRKQIERINDLIKNRLIALYPLKPVPVTPVQVVAKYHIGLPMDIIDLDPSDIQNVIYVPQNHPATIALEVNGDSLIDVGIESGDYVLLNTYTTPKDGDLVAVRLNGGEGVVKYYRKVGNNVYLYSANKNYPPIKITEDMDAHIVGVVVGVWKRTPPPPPEVWNDGKETNTR